jgi:hypothetical protein
MKRVFAVVLAAACVVGSTPTFARGGFGHGGGFRGGFVRNPTTLLGSPAPRMPAFQNRVPAPLAAPTQPIWRGHVARHRANSRECRCFLAAARWIRNPGVQARAKLQLQAQAGARREYIHFDIARFR